jgi:organic radical activating enzyme
MQNEDIKSWKIRVLDTKSESFCGAKWFNSTIWLRPGRTASCHHNPGHNIDLEEIKTNPSAIHNTAIKKEERRMMQRGEKPLNCQYCWTYEELHPDNLGDRVFLSKHSSEEDLQRAFDAPWDEDIDLDYIEVAFDRTCQMACSYCWPGASTTWVKDLKKNGPYVNLPTDIRNHHSHVSYDDDGFDYGSDNPYINAFFKWWDQSLHKSIKTFKITGGEPFMSGYLWDFFDMLVEGRFKTDAKISICTNLGIPTEKVQKFLDIVEKTGLNFEITTSGEAFGKKGTYVRDGLDWDTFVRNFELIRNSPLIKNPIFIMGTVNAPAVDGFLGFLNWVKEQKEAAGSPGAVNYSITPVRFPTYQNLFILPMELRQQYSQEIRDYMHDPDNLKWFNEYDLVNINRFIHYVATAEVPHKEVKIGWDKDKDFDKENRTFDVDELSKDFKSFFTQFDQRRGNSFVETYPRLADWYNAI